MIVGSCLGAVGLRSARDGSLLVIWGDPVYWEEEEKKGKKDRKGEKGEERKEVSNKILSLCRGKKKGAECENCFSNPFDISSADDRRSQLHEKTNKRGPVKRFR